MHWLKRTWLLSLYRGWRSSRPCLIGVTLVWTNIAIEISVQMEKHESSNSDGSIFYGDGFWKTESIFSETNCSHLEKCGLEDEFAFEEASWCELLYQFQGVRVSSNPIWKQPACTSDGLHVCFLSFWQVWFLFSIKSGHHLIDIRQIPPSISVYQKAYIFPSCSPNHLRISFTSLGIFAIFP